MITVFREDGKPLLEIESDTETTEAIIYTAKESFEPVKAVCAGCGAIGSLAVYCRYERWLTVLLDGAPKYKKLELYRCRCKICGKTHVIAQGEVLIPFMRHSLLFIIAVLEAYAKRSFPVRDIADRFQIAVSTLYDWAERFLEHYELLSGRLAATSGDIRSHIETLKQVSASLFYCFTEKFKLGFLQGKRKGDATRNFTLRGFLFFCSGAIP